MPLFIMFWGSNAFSTSWEMSCIPKGEILTRKLFRTQFHPEARGGPLDSSYLFDNYLESVKRYKDSQAILQPNKDARPSPLLVDLLAKERVGVVPTLGMENMSRANSPIVANAGPEATAAAAAWYVSWKNLRGRGWEDWVWSSNWPFVFEISLSTRYLQMKSYELSTSHVLNYRKSDHYYLWLSAYHSQGLSLRSTLLVSLKSSHAF